MAALMRDFDWSRTALGDPAWWPDTLKAAVATCLASRFPMVVWWGPELIMLYNDAWQPILGETKHPAGLGRPGAESWPETWPIVGQQFQNALDGRGSWSENLLLASDRRGFLEECYFTYSHSPLKDASGHVVGVLTAVIETTDSVLSDRRMRVLRDLSAATVEAASQARSLTETCEHLLGLLCSGNPDIPFAAQYIPDGSGIVSLMCTAGIERSWLPNRVSAEKDDAWGIAKVLRDLAPVTAEAIQTLPGGAWPEPTREILTLPLTKKGAADLLGVLVIGINSRLRLDERYRDFLKLVASELAGSIAAIHSIDRINLLMREVNHRAKNLLNLVQAIARQTASSTPAEFLARFETRLHAVARSHDLLVLNEWRGVDLRELAQSQLAHFFDHMGSRFELTGPTIFLCAPTAHTLGMTFHELATNAGKYGALSNGSGVVQVSWSVEAGDEFSIEWRERGGPAVSQPSNSGFGSTVISRLAEQSLDAQIDINYLPTGLIWQLRCPLGVIVGNALDRSPRYDRKDFTDVPATTRPRVLVVEDDAIVGLEVAQGLQAAGFDVLGPTGNVHRALQFVNDVGCDAAVLDINLGGKTSEPVAARLRQSGTPFVTVSGYAQHQSPEVFAGTDFLQKPLNLDALIKLLKGRIELVQDQ